MRVKALGRIFLAACIWAVCFLLTGCNVSVGTRTEMFFSTEFVGYRTITCTVYRDSNTTEAIDWLDAYLAGGGCPAEFQYVRTDGENGEAVYQFRMDFTSFEDYYSKVCSILGTEPVYNYQQADGLMAAGITYEESWSGTDLVRWTTDALVSAGIVSESDASGLFKQQGNDVYYNGELLSSGNDRISVDNLKTYSLERVAINTRIGANAQLQRQFTYYFPYTLYLEKEEELKQAFAVYIPEAAQSDWFCNDETQTAYLHVSFTADSEEDLIKMTNTATGSQLASFVIEEGESDKLLSKVCNYYDSIDLSGLFFNTDQLMYEYTFTTNGASKILSAFNLIEGYEIYPDEISYFTYQGVTEDSINFESELEESYTLDNIELRIETVNDDRYNWTVHMELGSQIPIEIVDRLYDYFKRWQQQEYNLTLAKQSAEETTSFDLIYKGNIDEMNNYLKNNWGEGNRITCDVVKDGFASEIRNYSITINTMSFREILGYYGLIDFYYETGRGETLTAIDFSGDGTNVREYGRVDKKGNYTEIDMPEQPYRLQYSSSLTSIVKYVNVVLIWSVVAGIIIFVLVIVIILLYNYKKYCKAHEISHDSNREFFQAAVLFYKDILKKTVCWLHNVFWIIAGGILPQGARREVALYFWGTKWTGIVLILGVVIGILSKSLIIIGISIIIAMTVHLVNIFAYCKERELYLDKLLVQDLDGLERIGIKRLGLDPEELTLIEPLVIRGPYLIHSEDRKKNFTLKEILSELRQYFIYRIRQKLTIGSDGKTRYPLVQVSCYYFSQHQCFTYTTVIDLITGKELSFKTQESFYRDVNCVLVSEKTISTQERMKNGELQVEGFSIVTRSGCGESAYQELGNGSLKEKVSAAKYLLREIRAELSGSGKEII